MATAYKNRGNAYDDKGEYDRALEDYEQALAINPQDADVFNSRGTTYTALGRYEHAIQDFDQAVKLNQPVQWLSATGALQRRSWANSNKG